MGGVIGNLGDFLNQYSKTMKDRQERKMTQATGLMAMAKQWDEAARNAEDPKVRDYATENWHKIMLQVEKTMNEKTGGYGLISKVLGFGKKKEGGEPALSFQPEQRAETEIPIGAAGGTRPALETPPAAPLAAPPSAGAAPALPGAVAEGMAGAPETQLPAPRETFRAPIPVRPDLPPGTVYEEHATGRGLESVRVPKSGGGWTTEYRLGGDRIGLDEFHELRRMKFLAQSQSEEREVERVGLMESQKAMAKWTSEFTDQQAATRADQLVKSGVAKQGDRLWTAVRYGIQVPPQYRDIDRQDPATGVRTRTLIDVATNTAVLPPETVPPTAHDLELFAYVDSQRAKDFTEAESMWARDKMGEEDVRARIRSLQADNSAEALRLKRITADLKQQLASGKADRAWAQKTYSNALNIAMGASYEVAYDENGSPYRTLNIDKVIPITHWYIQSEFNLTWEQFKKIGGQNFDPDLQMKNTVGDQYATDAVKRRQGAPQGPTAGGGRTTGGPAGSTLGKAWKPPNE